MDYLLENFDENYADREWTDDEIEESIAVLLTAKRVMMDNGWCRGAAARNIHGVRVNLQHPEEIDSVCFLGALSLAQRKHELRAGLNTDNPVALALYDAFDGDQPANVNDMVAKSKKEMVGYFDKAVEILMDMKKE